MRRMLAIAAAALAGTSACRGPHDASSAPEVATPRWMGTWQLGTAADDHAAGVAVDASGSVYVTGWTAGALGGAGAGAGARDAFVAKRDASGTVAWIRQLGTSGDDEGHAIAVDAAGDVYVAGSTTGGLDGNASAGASDGFLVKYDASGRKLWTRQLGSAVDDHFAAVAVDHEGNAYVAGSTLGALEGNASAGSWDGFLAAYDASGAVRWVRQFGGAFLDEAFGVAVDASGGVYVTGYVTDGPYETFLAKYDAAGNHVWERRVGTQAFPTTDNYGVGVVVAPSGAIYVAGDGRVPTPLGASYHPFLAKCNPAGDVLWTEQLTDVVLDGTLGPALVHARGVAVDPDGSAQVTGSTNVDLVGDGSAGQVFLARYDGSGSLAWVRQLGVGAEPGGVATDGAGDAFVAGSTSVALEGTTSLGGVDAFVARYDALGVKR